MGGAVRALLRKFLGPAADCVYSHAARVGSVCVDHWRSAGQQRPSGAEGDLSIVAATVGPLRVAPVADDVVSRAGARVGHHWPERLTADTRRG